MKTIIDISKWQQEINWAAASQSVGAVWNRVSIGDYYTDNMFATNYEQEGLYGILRGAYHVIAPQVDPSRQVERFVASLGGRVLELGVILDCEINYYNRTPQQVADNILGVADRLRARGFNKQLIYTRATWWNLQVARSTRWEDEFGLHVAHYTTAGPTLPIDWDDWVLWQFSDSGNISGITTNVDLNRFNGTDQQFLAYFGLCDEVPPPATKYVQTTTVANIRNRPEISPITDVGNTIANATFEYIDESAEWYEVRAFLSKKVAIIKPP